MNQQIPKIPTKKLEKIIDHYLTYFKLDGVPLNEIITEGQKVIFFSILYEKYNRIQIICSTQYGKSLITALASLILTCIFKKKIVIVAPSNNKARIIMRYFIEHLGDDEIFYSELEQNTKLERLKQELTQTRIILRNGGGIFIVSTQEKNSRKNIESAMGEGADIVIEDEACLISDKTEATVFRMISGKNNGRYIKIGNPFYSTPPYTHFKESWNNPNYFKIFIDYQRGLQEGRYTESFIEEARNKPMFDILYACEFPNEDIIDERGYRSLIYSTAIKYGITKDRLKEIIRKDKEQGKLKTLKLGCDIGGGGDYNVYVLRYKNFAIICGYNRSNDTMTNVAEIERIMKEFPDLDEENIAIDDIGIGRGIVDRLKEKDIDVNGVSVGSKSSKPDLFMNLKAELYWKTKKWLEKDESRLEESDKWTQLLWIKYKTNSERQIKIEPKEELKKRTGKSPDFAEALMLTFYNNSSPGIALI